ncbi:lytic transglycosylase domain-containing protein [Agrobacterium vitis]
MPISDGASLGMPSVTEDDPAPAAAEPATTATSAVILDELVATRSLGKRPMTRVALPRAQRMGQSWSAEQQRMRTMATEVALSYSRRPGVIRAQLDRDAFVALFTTMIHRESNFRPRAVSSAGAKGLGQLMPATARDLGVCDVFSPRENLEGAATYLTAMLDQFGSPAMALAAYNAGPGAVSRYGGVPPYRETRQYVADIIHAVERTPRRSEPDLAVNALTYNTTGQQDDGQRPDLWMAFQGQMPEPQRARADCLNRPVNSATLAYD